MSGPLTMRSPCRHHEPRRPLRRRPRPRHRRQLRHDAQCGRPRRGAGVDHRRLRGRHAGGHGDERLSEPAVPDADRHDAAVLAGAVQRHARSSGAPCGSRLPGESGCDPDHVLRSRGCARVDGAGQHRHGGDPRADGDGDGRPHPHPAFSDGNHGRQRRQLGLAVAVCADRHHREQPDGPQWPSRPRSADLSLQPRRPRHGRLRRLFPVRRAEAVCLDRGSVCRSRRSAGERHRVRPPPLVDARRDRLAHPERHRLRGQRRHGCVSRFGRAGALEGGGRWRGDQADAVAGDRDGLRRDSADCVAGEGAGDRSARVAGRENRHQRHRDRSGRPANGYHLRLQQHLRGCAAGISPDGAGPRAAAWAVRILWRSRRR